MAERGPLGDGGHLDQAEGDADGRADSEGQENVAVGDGNVLKLAVDAELQQSAADSEHHADFSSEDAPAGGGRRVHPLERQNEEGAGNEINQSDECLAACERSHGFVGRLDLNIFTIRSVMRNPPTMLLVAAMVARIPRMRAVLLS